MGMKFEVNIEKKYALGVILSVLILVGAIFVYAQWVPPTVWHDEGAVKVTVGTANTEKSLGDAINSDLCQKDGANWLNCPSSGGGGGSGTCTLIGSRNAGQQFLAVDVPAQCKGKSCDLILVSSSGTGSSFASFRYIQDVIGSPTTRDWLSEGAVRDNYVRINLVNAGTQANGQEEIASISPGSAQQVILYDDFSTENNRDKWALYAKNVQGSLYLCS